MYHEIKDSLDCESRVAVLYGLGSRFLCRQCYDLPYGSQQETNLDRMMRKARKIRQRLGGSDDLSEPIWQKPKGMHQKTFEQLIGEERAVSQAVDMAIEDKLRMFGMKGWL